MKFKKSIVLGLFILIANTLSAQNTLALNEKFNKIVISPHIDVVFIKGDTPSIELTEISVSEDKFKHEVSNNTLQVYLEDARTYTKKKKENGIKTSYPMYDGTVAKVVVTYTAGVNSFSVRGEQKVIFENTIEQEKCSLRFYGSSEILVKDVNVDELIVEIYGNSFLTMEKGTVKKQKLRGYGASTIIALGVQAKTTKLSAYGDGNYQLNSSETIKVDSYGQAKVRYKGDAILKRGIVLGKSSIERME